jgi:hypothetical protein
MFRADHGVVVELVGALNVRRLDVRSDECCGLSEPCSGKAWRRRSPASSSTAVP